MQTFLPCPQFQKSAQCLDDKRLGKQRVETLQILMANRQGPKILWSPEYGFRWGAELRDDLPGFSIRATPWYGHPCSEMWREYQSALSWYGLVVCDEWVRRGFVDNTALKIREFMTEQPTWPSWLTDDRLHASHRSSLLRKDSVHYGAFGWKESPDLPYWWPTRQGA